MNDQNVGGEQTGKKPPPLPADFGKALAPVRASERISSLDILRGAALLGILVINIIFFSHPLDQLGLRAGLWQSSVDVIAEFLSLMFVEGKCYTLFSLLFGMGFAMQMKRARQRGQHGAKMLRRRLLVLMGIGVAHGIFLWDGDVLFLYGIFGFLLMAFENRRPKTLVVWATALLGIQFLILLFLGMLVFLIQGQPEFSDVLEIDEFYQLELEAAYITGSYWDAVSLRAGDWLEATLLLALLSCGFLAMFLLGMHPQALAVMSDPDSHRPWLRKCAWSLAAIGLPICGLSAVLFLAGASRGNVGTMVIGVALTGVGGPTLCLAYVSAFLLMAKRVAHTMVMVAIGRAGRMALSNYLLQSLVATTIFYSHGLGLAESMGRLATILVAGGIFAGQVIISYFWLERFRFGPMEWLWRSLSYGKWQAMKL